MGSSCAPLEVGHQQAAINCFPDSCVLRTVGTFHGRKGMGMALNRRGCEMLDKAGAWEQVFPSMLVWREEVAEMGSSASARPNSLTGLHVSLISLHPKGCNCCIPAEVPQLPAFKSEY